MRDLWRGPTSSSSSRRPRRPPPRTRRARCRCCSSAACARRSSSARPRTSCARGWIFRRVYGAHGSTSLRLARVAPTPGALAWELGAVDRRAAAGATRSRPAMSDTLVFIPAWNEEDEPPRRARRAARRAAGRRRARRRRRLDRPHRRGRARARRGGALARREPRPAASGSPPATAARSSTATRTAAASTPTASIRPRELARLLELVRADHCDVAVGSRFVSGDGYAPTATCRAPRAGSARRSCGAAMKLVLGGLSATRRAASTPSTRRRCRCSPSRTRAGRRRSRRSIRDRGRRPAARGGAGDDGGACERRVEAPRLESGEARADGRRGR